MQPPFIVDLLDSNIALFGSAMSGKTTFIKTLINILHKKYNEKQEQIFIKIGKIFRVDFDLRIPKGYNPFQITNFMHTHLPGIEGNIPGLLIVKGHIPLGLYISGLLGGIFNKRKEGLE